MRMTGPEIEFVGGSDPEPADAADELAQPRRSRRGAVGAVIVFAALLVTGLVTRALHSDPARPTAKPAPLLTPSHTSPAPRRQPVLEVGRPLVVGQDGASCLHLRADGAVLYGIRLTNVDSRTVDVHGVHAVPPGGDRIARVGVGFPCGLPRQLLEINHGADLTVRPHTDFWIGAVIRPHDPCVLPDAIAFRVLVRVGHSDVVDPVVAEVLGSAATVPSSCGHSSAPR